MSDPLDPPEATEEWFRSAKLSVYRDAAYYGYGFAKAGKHVPIEEVFVAKPIPTYVCHKRVQALEVRSVSRLSLDANGSPRREVVFADPAFTPIYLHESTFTRYTPEPGDYYVVYEDGYCSFSPRKALLEGYSLASEGSVLMERLNDVAMAGPGIPPTWLQGDDWVKQLARVAREAYITINSLKHRIETLERKASEKANPDQA